MTKAALLVIDWQKGFNLPGAFGPRNNPEAEENSQALIVAWRKAGWPVVIIQHMSKSAQSPFAPGQVGNELQDWVQRQPGEALYEKQENSGFVRTTLEQDLRDAGLTKLVCIGATTQHCVSTTVRMGENLGFDMVLVTNACFAHEQHLPDGAKVDADTIHQANVASLNDEFAQVLTTDQVLAWFG